MSNFADRARIGVKHLITASLTTVAAAVSSTSAQQTHDFGGQELVFLT
jgi:hypothetical protein